MKNLIIAIICFIIAIFCIANMGVGEIKNILLEVFNG